jgi:hypothetical protein
MSAKVSGSLASASAQFMTNRRQHRCRELERIGRRFENARAPPPYRTGEMPVDPDVVDGQATGVLRHRRPFAHSVSR